VTEAVVDIPEQLVVIGGDAAGMAAAAQAKRLRGDTLSVVAFERGDYTSYSACGIPYWIAGDVDGAERLVVRSPQAHRSKGLDVRTATEVLSIDPAAQCVEHHDLRTGAIGQTRFDQLVIATGGLPVRPALPGVDYAGILAVQTLDDGGRVLRELEGGSHRRCVVVGAGYVGIEMAEAMARRGLHVTVVDRAEEPMTTLDPDMGALVRQAMEAIGIQVRTRSTVTGFEGDRAGRVARVVTSEGSLAADVVILGIGVRPNSALAARAGLPLGDHGGIRTDSRMRVPGHDNLWAGGDCVEVLDLVSRQYRHVPLGTHANKHGRVIGLNIGGVDASFPGVLGTAVSKVCDLEIGRTGLLEDEARHAGFEAVTATVRSSTKAGYFPGNQPVTVKMIAQRGTGLLLGAQIVAGAGGAKRIDTAATALWHRMTVEEMISLDLAYAPPLSPLWDPVVVAARRAAAVVRASV
jgi:NADPH-dependent 2,4-dienoyl-CoA reductase/sulfur reductase-like enzyme